MARKAFIDILKNYTIKKNYFISPKLEKYNNSKLKSLKVGTFVPCPTWTYDFHRENNSLNRNKYLLNEMYINHTCSAAKILCAADIITQVWPNIRFYKKSQCIFSCSH